MKVTITRIDGALSVDPAPPYLLAYLKYFRRSFKQKYYQIESDYEERLLYSAMDHGIVTLPGFYQHIVKLIKDNYDMPETLDHRTEFTEPDWSSIQDIKWENIGSTGLRDYQINPIVDLFTKAQFDSGIINCTGGWGKSMAQAITYAAYKKFNTILAIPSNQVFNQTYDIFSKLFPSTLIGRVGNGYHDISDQLTISTFRSLKNCALEKCKVFMADEIQCTAGDQIYTVINSINPIRMFGFTATDKNLFSGADKILKGLFGERLIFIPYEEAQEVKAVVPGVVYFVRVDPNITITASSIRGKISQGIKSCSYRNKLIGQICEKIPKSWQTLIFVDHVADHLVNLHKVLPDGVKYVHRESSKDRIGKYALTKREQETIIEDFKNNHIKTLLATDCLRQGSDFPNCRVVIQASGGTSEVELLQEAFRGSRILPENKCTEWGVEPKTHFVLIDFIDSHDISLENMSYKRMKIYKKQGWTIKEVSDVEKIDWYDYDTT